jgi:type III secretion protein T
MLHMEQDGFIKFFVDSVFMNEQPQSLLLLMLLGLFRLLPIIGMAPFFGAKVLPHPVKVVMGVVLFFIFLPQILVTTKTPPSSAAVFFAYGFKELFIGFSIGFMASVPFYMAEAAGVFIDHQRGGTSLMVQDPIMQNQDSPIGALKNYILIVTFFMLQGQFMFYEAILTSYQTIPIDAFFTANFFTERSEFWITVIDLLATIVRVGVQIAAPALITILMTDVFLGIANRLAPQVMITFLGMPLKAYFGLGVLALGWTFIMAQLKKELVTWLFKIDAIVNMFESVQ